MVNTALARRSSPVSLRVIFGVLLGLLVLSFTLGTGAPAAHAATSETCVADATTGCFTGTIKGVGAGVKLTIDGNGQNVVAETNKDGKWNAAVTAAGTYTITLDVNTLPKGVTLKGDAVQEREITLGFVKATIFAVDGATGEGADNGPTQDEIAAEGFNWDRLAQQVVSGLRLGLLLALASIGLTLWVTWQLEGGAAAVNEAGRMRMQTWRMASEIQAGIAEDQRMARIAEFDQNLAVLEQGDPVRPLFVPWDPVVRSRFTAVQALWRAQRADWASGAAAQPGTILPSTHALVDAIDALVSAIEQQLSKLTAVLNLFQFVMMALAIVAAVVMLYTGYLYVINPLAQLQTGLRRVEEGDFQARIEVDSQDEFGLVAQGFNGMAARLQDMVDGLEAQVRAKTQRIEAQRARIETLYDFSAFLAGVNSIEEMSRGFAQRLRAVMGADAVTVRWSDEANQRYLMLASDCFPQEMLEEERSLLAGACACGSLRPESRTRVIPILSHEEMPLRHCAKVGYQSVVSVPIRLQQRLLGEFNLFFRSAVALSAEETELLDALASHLASALESLRAAALARAKSLGFEVICQYYGTPTSPKILTPVEAQRITDAGLLIFSVFENLGIGAYNPKGLARLTITR